jgi:hypothetical protein
MPQFVDKHAQENTSQGMTESRCYHQVCNNKGRRESKQPQPVFEPGILQVALPS